MKNRISFSPTVVKGWQNRPVITQYVTIASFPVGLTDCILMLLELELTPLSYFQTKLNYFYGIPRVLLGETASRITLVSFPGAVTRWLLDLLIPDEDYNK